MVDDIDIGGLFVYIDVGGRLSFGFVYIFFIDIKLVDVYKDCMCDFFNLVFYDEVWLRVVENNIRIYWCVFCCMLDLEVINWVEYKEFDVYN